MAIRIRPDSWRFGNRISGIQLNIVLLNFIIYSGKVGYPVSGRLSCKKNPDIRYPIKLEKALSSKYGEQDQMIRKTALNWLS